MQIDFYNPRSIILFVCILQGVIFAALLLVRYFKRKQRADFWLAILLLLSCSSMITSFIGFANVYDLNQWLTYFPFNISYAYGVGVWFYVLSLTDSNRKFSRRDLLLFIPSAIYLIFRSLLFAQSLEFKGWFNRAFYVPVAEPVVFITELIWNMIFLYLSLRHYRKYRAWLNENFSDIEKIKFDWLRNFLYIFTFVLILGAIFDSVNTFIFELSYIQYFYFEFVIALVTYYLAIAGYLRSQTIELSFTETESEKPESRKTLLPANDLENLKIRLQNLMEKEKPFLDSQLTLTDLARKLGVNSTIVSYAINSGFGRNFNDFINGFRIEEVKTRLQSDSPNNASLLDIAFDAGFNSKATFNRAFKKFTGVAPKEFQSAQNSTASN